jgi:teichoic acid ribitol-phosphate primase
VRLGFALGRLLPVRARVVLASQRTTRLSGNLAYIERELGRRTPPIAVTVLAYRTRPGLRGRIEEAWHAFRAGYHLAAARVFVVDEWFLPMYVVGPRPGTIRVQAWHAAGALKKFGYSVLDKSFGADEELVSQVPMHANYDVCLISASSVAAHYMDAFRLPRERFSSALGLPRTDLFFDAQHRARATAAIRQRYGLPAERKVLLYAPTFRGDTVRDASYQDHLDLAVMREALADEWLVLVRLHPFVRRGLHLPPDMAGFAIDASDWPEMNELMFVTDLLVTDYSSSIFEFALLDRPMAFLAPDYEAYERERGLYIDFRTAVPGPIFDTTADLAEYVAAGDFDLARIRAFARQAFDIADGHASERFVDRIVLPALRGERVQLEAEPAPPARIIATPGRAPKPPTVVGGRSGLPTSRLHSTGRDGNLPTDRGHCDRW